MRRRRRVLALLFIFSAFFTPLGFFYFTIANESRSRYSDDSEENGGYQTMEVSEPPETIHVDFKKFSEDECSNFPPNMTRDYPECESKMRWIRNEWKTHHCYAENYVDGSECSFRYYLSQVESYCPLMEENTHKKSLAKMSPSIRRLLPIFDTIPHYMKTRINRLWKKWKEGAHEVMEKYSDSMSNRKKLNVLVFVGFLANEKQLKLAKKSDHGGPLGELLQWSDLLATLSIIGHHLEVSTDKDSLRRCRIRLLDSFGTHAEFTNKSYFLKNKRNLSGPISQRNPWGGHGLDLRQHWTFYPHSDDNTFLGFVVDTEGVNSEEKEKRSYPSALVYGKEMYMWDNAQKPIRILKKFVNIYATVADLKEFERRENNGSSLFNDVQNHGFLNSDEISALLDKTNIFFGLGFPLEGPAPLEAMAHGAVFINAKFKEPKSRKNYRFLAEKPTLREWTSQNPYMEKIGEPHVITVDIDDEEALEAAIKRAIQLKPEPFVPFEFSPAGMLLRVALLLEKQEICDKIAVSKRWPPVDQMKIFRTVNPEDSCEIACRSQNLLCEPSYFPTINSSPLLTREFSCPSTSADASPLAPFNCTTQSSASLFSCASRPPPLSDIIRICPCRDYIPQQHAICTKCL